MDKGAVKPMINRMIDLAVDTVTATFNLSSRVSPQEAKEKIQYVFPYGSLTIVVKMKICEVRTSARIQGTMITFLARLTVR